METRIWKNRQKHRRKFPKIAASMANIRIYLSKLKTRGSRNTRQKRRIRFHPTQEVTRCKIQFKCDVASTRQNFQTKKSQRRSRSINKRLKLKLKTNSRQSRMRQPKFKVRTWRAKPWMELQKKWTWRKLSIGRRTRSTKIPLCKRMRKWRKTILKVYQPKETTTNTSLV